MEGKRLKLGLDKWIKLQGQFGGPEGRRHTNQRGEPEQKYIWKKEEHKYKSGSRSEKKADVWSMRTYSE